MAREATHFACNETGNPQCPTCGHDPHTSGEHPSECDAVRESEEHLRSLTGIPDTLEPVLFQAEMECRMNEADVLPTICIDHGRGYVQIDNNYQGQALLDFMWEYLMRTGGRVVHLKCVGEDDHFHVIYLDASEAYSASASLEQADRRVAIGPWKIVRLTQPESSGSAREEKDDTTRMLVRMIAHGRGAPWKTSKECVVQMRFGEVSEEAEG